MNGFEEEDREQKNKKIPFTTTKVQETVLRNDLSFNGMKMTQENDASFSYVATKNL